MNHRIGIVCQCGRVQVSRQKDAIRGGIDINAFPGQNRPGGSCAHITVGDYMVGGCLRRLIAQVTRKDLRRACIMHEPLAFADEEGVGGGDGEIIHRAGFVAHIDSLYRPERAVDGADVLAELEVAGGDPASYDSRLNYHPGSPW
jgi:hypothetical protein